MLKFQYVHKFAVISSICVLMQALSVRVLSGRPQIHIR